MTFLCVDDSATVRKIISMALAEAGHSAVEAENGRIALDKLASANPDCVILDINMPVMGGIEFLSEKKKLPSAASVPVIVLTTQDEEALRSQAMGLGANGFLAKPFDKAALLASIARILG
jgi:Response regulator containing CheY-like receiver, AAA-type ATPase, and DNA-binding domains